MYKYKHKKGGGGTSVLCPRLIMQYQKEEEKRQREKRKSIKHRMDIKRIRHGSHVIVRNKNSR